MSEFSSALDSGGSPIAAVLSIKDRTEFFESCGLINT